MGKKIDNLKKCRKLFAATNIIVDVPFRSLVIGPHTHWLKPAIFLIESLNDHEYYRGFGDKSFGLRCDSTGNAFNLPFFYRDCPVKITEEDENAAFRWLSEISSQKEVEVFFSPGIAVCNNYANVVLRKDNDGVCIVEYSFTGEPQRYGHNKKTTLLGISNDSGVVIWHGNCFKARKVSDFNCLKLSRVYNTFIESGLRELTYSVKKNGNIVIW